MSKRKVIPDGKSQVKKKKKERNIEEILLIISRAFLVALLVKNPPAMQESQVQSLGRVDPLEKEMTIHSNILAWRIPWIEEPGRLQSMGSQIAGHN